MDSTSEESSKFIVLIEQHSDVLIKSRVVELTKRKEAAAAEIIKKWAEVAGKTLTQAGLYKKINNIKSRAKLASSGGKKLSDWQSKLLEIGGSNSAAEEDQDEDTNLNSHATAAGNTADENATSVSGAGLILDQHETLETKLLNNEQLQRLVLLKQVKVLTLQQQRLEASVLTEKERNVEFEFIGWEGANQTK